MGPPGRRAWAHRVGAPIRDADSLFDIIIAEVAGFGATFAQMSALKYHNPDEDAPDPGST